VHDWETRPAPAAWKQRFPEGFHRILLDTPCSNTGVIRRRVDVRWRLQPDFLAEIVNRQERLLGVLLPMLRPGGRLAYSTCSIEPEENEDIVRAVLARLPGYRQLQTRSLVPHLSGTDGAWVSLIERVV
jgi:16S rRNA (cytosine967-C5)-methyltransferase